MVCRTRLPEHHLSKESTDVIKLATGLVATLVALVLSLLISSANNLRATVENEYKAALTSVVQLDQYLGAYGPQAADARKLLRRTVAQIAALHWPEEDFSLGTIEPVSIGKFPLIDLERRIIALTPSDDGQKWFQSQALQLASRMAQLRQLLASQQATAALPGPVLYVVLICSAAIFASFALFVPPNSTVILSFVIAALAVAAAIFLITDLGDPFSGFLQVSSAPVHSVLRALGQ
jgi:hypothetical protein